MDKSLSKIALENESGQSLTPCARCRCKGRFAFASRTEIANDGEMKRVTKKIGLNARHRRAREGWEVKVETCDRCQGAGLCVVGGSR